MGLTFADLLIMVDCSLTECVVLASLVSLLSTAECSPLPESVCAPGYYLNDTCTPCSVCTEGHGLEKSCQGKRDTVCQMCPQGYFSQLVADNRLCTECSNCSILNRIQVSECTRLQNSECGKCSEGHFLLVKQDGSTECAKCSLCPPDKDAVRWYECAHLPDSEQCAPGYTELVTENSVTVATDQQQQWELFSRVASNRKVFVSIATQGETAQDAPVFEILVSVVSIIFTVLTVTVFCCAVVASLYRRLSKLRRSRTSY